MDNSKTKLCFLCGNHNDAKVNVDTILAKNINKSYQIKGAKGMICYSCDALVKTHSKVRQMFLRNRTRMNKRKPLAENDEEDM